MSAPHSNLPEMSVVLVTRSPFRSIRKTIRHLSRQTFRDRLELLIVAPSRERLALEDSEVQGFGAVRVLEVGPILSIAQAKLSAVRNATSPVIAFAEDHCYPEPDWAEHLIKAHREPWAAVGPSMKNANPNTLNSWASYLMSHARWNEPVNAGPMDSLPWHNTSYKRQLLLEYGSELPALLGAEGFLQQKLAGRGYQLYLSPMAKVNHVNVSLGASVVAHAYVGGRLFGAKRACYGKWSPWLRLLRVGATPLIPLVRLRSICADILRIGEGKRLLPLVLPALIVGLTFHALGESVGYTLGVGNTEEQFSNYEMTRIEHLTERDRQVELAG
jgi:glycosyltransferase involved in cell wall biosynthesis